MKLIPKAVATLITESSDATRVRDGLTSAVQPVLNFLNAYFKAAGDGSLTMLRSVAFGAGATFAGAVSVAGAIASTGAISGASLASANGIVGPLGFGSFWNTAAAANTYYQLQETVVNQNNNTTIGLTPRVFKFPRAGSIVGYSYNNAGPLTAMNFLAYYKNGTRISDMGIGTGNGALSGTHPKGQYAFAPNDVLTASIGNASAGNLQVSVILDIELSA